MIQFPINSHSHQYHRPTQIGPQPNPNNNNNFGGRGLRRPRDADDDWDICWDFLSPKGCNRETCRWRHGQRYVFIYFCIMK